MDEIAIGKVRGATIARGPDLVPGLSRESVVPQSLRHSVARLGTGAALWPTELIYDFGLKIFDFGLAGHAIEIQNPIPRFYSRDCSCDVVPVQCLLAGRMVARAGSYSISDVAMAGAECAAG